MIPDYQKVMLPLLQFLGDGSTHAANDAFSIIANHFKLTEDERNQLLLTSKRKILSNRIHWARAYLKMAGLIENIEKFTIQITIRGKQQLEQKPTSLDTQFLMTLYPDFKEKLHSYRYKKKSLTSTEAEDTRNTSENIIQTPEELIEAGYQSIKKNIEQELLLKLKSVHPTFFEKIVVELLVKWATAVLLRRQEKLPVTQTMKV